MSWKSVLEDCLKLVHGVGGILGNWAYDMVTESKVSSDVGNHVVLENKTTRNPGVVPKHYSLLVKSGMV